MKRIICIIGMVVLLSACSSSFIKVEHQGMDFSNDVGSILVDNENTMYIEDEFKDVIKEINSLNEKYKTHTNQIEDEGIYIDIYDNNNLNIDFSNERISNKQYFNELVEILDRSLAKGLEDHIEDMESRDLKEGEMILRKIGRAVIYTEDSYGYEGNTISIKVNFSDLKDEYARNVLENVSDEKYILEDMIIGDSLNMIDFVKPNNRDYQFQDDYLAIRYNIFLKNKEIEKTNILLQNKDKSTFKEEDIHVFINLLDVLELNEEEKDLLLDTYSDILESKANNEKIDLDNYKVIINSDKAKIYSEKDTRLIYFSIEKI